MLSTVARGCRDRTPGIKEMRTRRIILAVAVCCAIACAPRYSATVSGPRGRSADAELAIYEMVIRNVVAEEEEVVLVSFGESWTDHVDPPEGFLDRLDDLEGPLKPVSERSRLPDPNALLYVVHLSAWRSDTQATVAVTRFRFGAGVSEGFTADVTWTDGIWRIQRTTGHWNT
jgi:hypothetical protein